MIAHSNAMFLVDTDVLIWLIRGRQEYIDWFHNIVKDNPIRISTISIAEIYKNVFPTELLRTEQVLAEFEDIPITREIAKQAGFYWKQFNKQYKTLHMFDCLIGATAKEHGLILITLNIRHFPMQDIQVYKAN